MKENIMRGHLSLTPFAGLLHRLWQKEKTGHLLIQKDGFEKALCFEKGNPVIDQNFFPEKHLLKILTDKKVLTREEAERVENHARLHALTAEKALVDLGLPSISRLWRLREYCFKTDLLPLFDWTEADFNFTPGEGLPKNRVLGVIPALPFILQGVRRMKNHDLIAAHLPPEGESIQVLTTFHQGQINLDSHEKYLLAMITGPTPLKTIYETSELGKRESRKVIFALLNLGLVGPVQQKSKTRSAYDFSPSEIDRILSSFNEKFSYIYKYISKQIGPVALNVLEKCLAESKSRLSSPFQKIEIKADGTMETRALLKSNAGIYSEESQKKFINGLNEILAAEVLTVKKTLGNEHESILVKNLEKVVEGP